MTELVDALNDRARDAGERPTRDITQAAVDAAFALTEIHRGWALVHLAGAYRDHGQFDRTLATLDFVWHRHEDFELLRAAFTCAIATHMDLGDTHTAILLCDEQRCSALPDEKFLRAEIRAREAWWGPTGDDAARAALERAQRELAALADATVPAR